MKIIDLKFTEDAEKMVKNYVKGQYASDYAARVQKRNKEQIEVLKNELVDKMSKADKIEEFNDLFVNGITKGIFNHKISDPKSKGVVDLKNKLLSDENIPLKLEKIEIFMTGCYKEHKIWNKGEFYRPCFPDCKAFFAKIGKSEIYSDNSDDS